MAKRKRFDEDERAADVGLGSTLAYLRNNQNLDNTSSGAVDDDDHGWTMVKKRNKRDRKDRCHGSSGNQRRESFHRPDSADSRSEDQQIRVDRDSLSADAPSSFDNPFAPRNEGNGERLPKSSNPFNMRKEAESGSEVAPRSQPTHNIEENKRDRVERGKERKLERNYPVIEHSHHARLSRHVRIVDLQSLALYILADGNAPQWVSVSHRMSIRHVVVLMVPGLELDMFNGRLPLDDPSFVDDKAFDDKDAKRKHLRVDPDDYYPARLKPDKLPMPLKPLCDIFPDMWPIKAQGDHQNNLYKRVHSPIHTMLTAPIPKSREEKQLKKNGHKGPLPPNNKHWEDQRTRVTQYIATLAEQQENEFVVHPACFSTEEAKQAAMHQRKAAKQTPDDGWVDTNVTCLQDGQVPENEIEQGSITAGRRILTVDCEMCKGENDEQVLTRISILDWDGNVVLDELVKPDVTIKDYLTQFSGITANMLENVTTTLRDIQDKLLELITPRTILVGHSLNSDLNALKLTHPFLIDTGVLFPHARGPPYKQSLKWLSKKFLGKEIQTGIKGHDSVEDARACLDLVKQKCERGPKWGTGEMNAESIFKRLGRATRPKSNGAPRTGAVVDWGEPKRGHGGHAHVSLGCQSDADIVGAMETALDGSAVGKDGTTQKVDFVWGRLRELELARGWWDDGRTSDDVETMRLAALKRLGLISKEGKEMEVKGSGLGDAVSQTIGHIVQIYKSLPRCTAFIVYSGTGDPRQMRRLQNRYQQYRRESETKKRENVSVRWTHDEEEALSDACQQARNGVGFIVVK